MKWYWWVLIIAGVILAGYWISQMFNKNKNPNSSLPAQDLQTVMGRG